MLKARKLRKLSERDIQEACCTLLAYDNWRRLRCEPVSRREWGKGFGEPGMADDLFIRYGRGGEPTEVMWIEWKAPGGKPTPGQLAWHAAERASGASTYVAGMDFERSVDGFLVWYRSSGWMRRPI